MEHSNSSSDTNAQSGMLNRVKETATAQLSSQKDRATDGLGSIASAVRESSRPLRDKKQDMIAEYVEKAADQLERYSTRLRERDVSELVNDAQQFARRRPALFVGAAFAVGVVAARFLKSSSSNGQSGAMMRRDVGSSHRFDRTPTDAPRYGSATGYSGGGM
jgi:ElaB/YqjD/DUF883 family membrane-anchored ribosome-binding protein